MNVVTKEKYSIESIQEEIKPENQIGVLEQLEQGIVAVETMVREMERTRIRGDKDKTDAIWEGASGIRFEK